MGKFYKTDRIHAVVSLVVYYGKEPWDGAKDLYDLLHLDDIPEEMRTLINHYPIHILDVRRFEHTEWFQTDLRDVFEFIQCAEDEAKFKEFVEKRREQLIDMSEEACDVIAAVTKTTAIPFKDARYRNMEGGIDMYKALDDWGKKLEENGRQRGQEQGLQEGLQQGLQLTSEALFQYGMTVEEFAAKYQVAVEQVRMWYEEWFEERRLRLV